MSGIQYFYSKAGYILLPLGYKLFFTKLFKHNDTMPFKRISLVLVVALLSTFCQAQVTSDFNTLNPDGWTAPGSLASTINAIATGGNPGGFASATPTFNPSVTGAAFPIYFYFNAPAKFHGDFSSYYGGNLTYDLQQGTVGAATFIAEVTISNPTTTLYYFPAVPFNPAATPTWTSYNVPLDELSGNWKTGASNTASTATQSNFKAVLSNVTIFTIRGRYNSILSPPPTGLDNVVFQPVISIVTPPVPQIVCDGTTATFSIAATGNNNITYKWQIFDTSSGVFTDLTNNAIYSGVSTPALAINTTGKVGVSNYRCKLSGSNTADVFTNSVGLTVNVNPTAPTVIGASNCGPGLVTLNASGGTPGQFRWYTISSGGTAITGEVNSSYTTPSISSTTTYYVSIYNGFCEGNRTSATATINILPSPPTVVGSASNCGSGTLTLNSSGGTPGQYRWYTVASGGSSITGEINGSYMTPSISSTTTYYVSIYNGFCESTRTLITATITSFPTPPTITNTSGCSATIFSLSAAGGTNGQYRWYSVVTGGTAIAGETNSNYFTPTLTSTTTYFVSINNGTCESLRTALLVTISTGGCTSPSIDSKALVTQIGGKVTLTLVPLIKTPGSTLDLASLTITVQPKSGAKASINNATGVLTIDYTGLAFSGNDQMNLRACDQTGKCASQQFTVDVGGDIIVFNALSPNGDNQNPIFFIRNIDAIPETKNNKVTIFDRWENQVWQGTNYDNAKVVFIGISDGGNDLPTGTYFYKIEFTSGRKIQTGFISLKR